MLGLELQHPFRHAAPRTRPHLPIRRRTRLRGSEIVHLPARYDPRLSGDLDAAGIRICKSPGNQVVRLRNVVLRITACERASTTARLFAPRRCRFCPAEPWAT